VLTVAAACGAPPRKICFTLPSPPPALDRALDRDRVQVTFLGVGGAIVRWQGAAILTAPLFSNPTVGEMALSEIHADRQLIDALLREDVSGVSAILVGHSHYDHLMDVPYVALHRAMRADVLGNDAMVKLLHPIGAALATEPRRNRLVSMQREAVYQPEGVPIRVKAIPSEHSPQMGPRLISRTARLLSWLIPLPEVTLWRGEDESERDVLPTRVGEWPAGTPLAFVIELLDPSSGAVAFRLYYQDSPTRDPYGYPERAPDGYDLALLTMGGATEFRSFPRDIVRHLDPKYVMGIHWEDFFDPRQLPLPREVNRRERILYAPGVDEKGFLRAVRETQRAGGRAIVPCPDMTATFVRAASGWEIAGDASAWTAPKR
jgi:L-ascorbate metabolism protein UlaG (beta-lactamase superfamily)